MLKHLYTSLLKPSIQNVLRAKMSTEHGGKKIMFGPFEVTSQVS